MAPPLLPGEEQQPKNSDSIEILLSCLFTIRALRRKTHTSRQCPQLLWMLILFQGVGLGIGKMCIGKYGKYIGKIGAQLGIGKMYTGK